MSDNTKEKELIEKIIEDISNFEALMGAGSASGGIMKNVIIDHLEKLKEDYDNSNKQEDVIERYHLWMDEHGYRSDTPGARVATRFIIEEVNRVREEVVEEIGKIKKSLNYTKNYECGGILTQLIDILKQKYTNK